MPGPRTGLATITGKVSARLAVELSQAMEDAVADAPRITLPMLLMHGGADTLTSVAGSQQLHAALGSGDKSLVVYPGMYHEIFNEPERLDVMTETRDWIDARLPATPEAA